MNELILQIAQMAQKQHEAHLDLKYFEVYMMPVVAFAVILALAAAAFIVDKYS
ncbi:MAG: hypothetical protein ACXABY_35480 [Candidatus Thorarchaeota archaeon]|jgi:hypothetical protein